MKTYFSLNSAKGLIESSEYLLDHIEDEEFSRNPNKFSFILVSAAALESLLNDGIISWALHTFPRDDHKRHATAFLSMNLGKKLDALGYLLSGGKYITDNTNQTYQILTGLIKQRNEVAHSKGFYIETEIEYGPINEDGSRSFELPDMVAKKMMNQDALDIDLSECKGIVSALRELHGILNYDIQHHDTELFKAL